MIDPVQFGSPVAPARAVAQGGSGAVEQPDVRKVAEDFTAVLMQMMVREMWKTVGDDESGPFGNGPGADVYRGLAETAFASTLAHRGSEPLVEAIQRAIARRADDAASGAEP